MRRPRSSLVDGPAGPGRGITWVVVFPAVTESGREHRHSLAEMVEFDSAHESVMVLGVNGFLEVGEVLRLRTEPPKKPGGGGGKHTVLIANRGYAESHTGRTASTVRLRRTNSAAWGSHPPLWMALPSTAAS